MKIFVVYDTKYGNTKLVAEKIIEGLEEYEELESSISDVESISFDKLPDFDVILIGSPNHVGGPARTINKFIDNLGKLELSGKQFAVFDTYMGGDFNKAVLKMEARIKKKSPDLTQITSGLSIKVDGMKGPVTEGEFPKCKEFGKTIGNLIKS
ncbi:MAG: flavodoxin family protein [Promethearchaeota archaeon]|jgi:flavodoxin